MPRYIPIESGHVIALTDLLEQLLGGCQEEGLALTEPTEIDVGQARATLAALRSAGPLDMDNEAVQRIIAANLAGDLSKLSREQMLHKLEIIAILVRANA